jgi:hypothetical protein
MNTSTDCPMFDSSRLPLTLFSGASTGASFA